MIPVSNVFSGMHVCMHACMHVYIYIHIYICIVCVCMYRKVGVQVGRCVGR